MESVELEAANLSSGRDPSGLASPWERRAAWSRQARPEVAQEPSSGTAKGGRFDHAAATARGIADV